MGTPLRPSPGLEGLKPASTRAPPQFCPQTSPCGVPIEPRRREPVLGSLHPATPHQPETCQESRSRAGGKQGPRSPQEPPRRQPESSHESLPTPRPNISQSQVGTHQSPPKPEEPNAELAQSRAALVGGPSDISCSRAQDPQSLTLVSKRRSGAPSPEPRSGALATAGADTCRLAPPGQHEPGKPPPAQAWREMASGQKSEKDLHSALAQRPRSRRR